jgi:uncharacterized protein YeaO (DUF488 family)
MKILIERVYLAPRAGLACQVLVDRFWPRGLRKGAVRIDLWLKDLSPSDALRRWFAHDPAKWEEFKRRYHEELSQNREAVSRLIAECGDRDILLLYSAHDQQHNQAAALKEYLERALVRP